MPPYTAQYGFTVRLGGAEECADGIYWVTIRINGKAIRTTMSPGDADSYSQAVTQTLGGPVTVTANAYLPIKKLQSNAVETDVFPEECPDIYSITVTDRVVGAASHSGTVYSKEYSVNLMNNPKYTPYCEVSGGGIDDWGSIGGASFNNQTVTQRPNGVYECSGLSTIIPTSVEVVKEGNKLSVGWSTTNSPYCGLGLEGPTGLVGVTFKFGWTKNGG